MRLKNKLILLASSLSAVGMTGCDTSDSCNLTNESCWSFNKILDVNRCKCVAPNFPNSLTQCQITQNICASVNKILDVNKCECVAPNSPNDPTQCQITQEICASVNKILDVNRCECVENSYAASCFFDDVYFPIGAKTCVDGQVMNCQPDGSMVVIEKCQSGCINAECVRRNCGNIEDGKTVCMDDNLVSICHDGELFGYDECDSNTQICRDGECVNINKNCGNIEDGKTVCMDNYLVSICLDGELFGYDECDSKQICRDGECVNINKNCGNIEGGDIEDGKTVCMDNMRLICHDGELFGDKECGGDTPLCRDGDSDCSPYRDCETIKHGSYGCKDDNIVLCDDGNILKVEDGDCFKQSKFCIADPFSESGFSCKTANSTDCEWKNGLIAQNESICDGNILLTCLDGVLSEGIDCSKSEHPAFCDPFLNNCREYNSCGNYGEIAHGSIICNEEGTNKIQCSDGKLVELTGIQACPSVKNANSICTFNTEATCSFVCIEGYINIDGECQKIARCDPNKETYNSSTNTCSCNTANHWTGTPGYCECESGYLPIGSVCEPKTSCDSQKEIFNSSTNTCSCNAAKHWTGTAGNCTCMDGYVLIDGVCEFKKICDPFRETYSSEDNTCHCKYPFYEHYGNCECWPTYIEIDNTCVPKPNCDSIKEEYDSKTNTCFCNTERHWTGTVGNCTCEEGYVVLNKYCQLRAVCKEGREKYNETTNTCLCNSANHWTGNAGRCTCISGYTDVGDICEPIVTCGDLSKEIYNKSTNTCSCDISRHWAGTVGSCTCEEGYLLRGNECIRKATCDSVKEIYNSSSNTCSCNTANHWTGTAGSCACANNYVQIGNTCELKKECTGAHVLYDASNNTCVCDTANGWAGSAESCQCTVSGFVQVGDTCQPKASCDFTKEIYNSDTNTCACDTANHWSGTPGACTCAPDYILIAGKCELRTVCSNEHERLNESTNTCACDSANGWIGTTGKCKCLASGFVMQNDACIPTSTLAIGDTVTFGHYVQSSSGIEPIEWIVIDKNGYLVLLSKKVLAIEPFDTEGFDEWDLSSIRSWLNGYGPSENLGRIDYTSNNFIDKAFTADEKNKIIYDTVAGHQNLEPIVSHIYPRSTKDKVYLLSAREFDNLYSFFNTSENRKAMATRYLVEHYATVTDKNGQVSHNGTCQDPCYTKWWLRTFGANIYFSSDGDVSYVTAGGGLDSWGEPSTWTKGIRPVIRLR